MGLLGTWDEVSVRRDLPCPYPHSYPYIRIQVRLYASVNLSVRKAEPVTCSYGHMGL